MENKTKKYDKELIITIILIILFLSVFTYLLGYVMGKQTANKKLYQMCRQFNFMAYLSTENLRHYQNSSFELSAMPNCEVYNNNITGGGSLTYDVWLERNNLTHINWTTGNKNDI